MTIEELECYFKSPKDEENKWYKLNFNGKKIWNEEKVKEFWNKIITHKLENKNYNFSEYHFPKFGNFSFSGNQKFVFDKEADFSYAIFEEGINFQFSKFNENVIFHNTKFNDDASFYKVEFNKEVTFESAVFNGKASFHQTKFKNEPGFYEVTFNREALFLFVEFNKEVDFDNVEYKDKASFLSVIFKENVTFNFSTFNGETFFSDVTFLKSAEFDLIVFKNITFERINLKLEPAKLIFNNIDFLNNSKFSFTNLTNIKYVNCNLSNIIFSRCNWSISDRLILINEEDDLLDAENHYRQLKKNFDDDKDWTMSGFAYISEMDTRKRTLFKENKLKWFLYWYYGFFGGYTQNYIKPLFSLVITFILFTIIYLFYDYNIITALQRSIYGLLPLININPSIKIEGYWLIFLNVQKLISSTFLTFFILGIRKQFKQ